MAANIVNQQDRLVVSGDLNFFTVMVLWKQSLTLLAELSTLEFDLSQVNSTHSAGLALIIEWIKYARKVNKPIQFSHIPSQLKAMITASGIDKILS